MSNAARPTFHAAIGRTKSGVSGSRVSAKDQIAHRKLKFRQFGQGSKEELASTNLKEKLEERVSLPTKVLQKSDNLITFIDREPDIIKFDDRDVDFDNESIENDDESLSESENEDEDEDEDDEAELQAALEKIKQERMMAQIKKEQEEKEFAEREARDQALKGNPLLNTITEDSSAKIKRRWNDDVVFRNQTRDEPTQRKRFVNDTIRNDFHKNFLKKFMK